MARKQPFPVEMARVHADSIKAPDAYRLDRHSHRFELRAAIEKNDPSPGEFD